MRCPDCDQPTEVVETRALQGRRTRRTRRCPDGHSFTTYEVLSDQLLERPRHERAPATEKHRRTFVLAHPRMTDKQLAVALGCSVDIIYRIRHHALSKKIRHDSRAPDGNDQRQ